VVKGCAARVGIKALAPHDLRSYAESRTMQRILSRVPYSERLQMRASSMAPCLKSSALCRMRHNRRTCARLCHAAGGELEQNQFLLGHASVQTTERYIGCKQDLALAVNDRLPFALEQA
jgi:site-specific recombinase XerD